VRDPAALRFLRAMMQIVGAIALFAGGASLVTQQIHDGAAYALVGACLVVSSRFFGLPPEA
jgi:hypothetical protein